MRTTLFSPDREMSSTRLRTVVTVAIVVGLLAMSWLDSALSFVLYGIHGTVIRDGVARTILLLLACGVRSVVSKQQEGRIDERAWMVLTGLAIVCFMLTWTYVSGENTFLSDLHMTGPDRQVPSPMPGSYFWYVQQWPGWQ